ncbi:hypothetical protein [Alicyclobacillus vulcanalis]|uniref:Uncharacterized protein n=1 Tax=Alicyclobacillus vulcanalis TaxID=252246 RepID=A0A1N7N4V2_9BACL|nr:hypothetical protein [Alicyclobacillus vulcanalis]SIS93392.1 hypothetical protein SAMN05421799_10775 [Alicyclobacillus vulcanalis]
MKKDIQSTKEQTPVTEAHNAIAQAERAAKQALSHTNPHTLGSAREALLQAEHAVEGAAGSSNPQAVASLCDSLDRVRAELQSAEEQKP